ncbi:glucose-methanol-choline (GMC) oxidoreductase [Formosa agariphila KMM 3901]|uniref:Glucose-methanol-choline (GMC) oxidoreductase n=1 Tax=Formosa agariphila (strain DSM 15362 / KCTC 12365 / LMG 23005 / KMM 3901 / M-2Alg 35-1) TaxID=1347342 RepID=T2KQT3_FORAG|nr:GMC family oxidoreductase [Formosa agariphila]CDF80334.1 glucose-methanol-choline (GMC) oxidoreductase [Formosa agariphila KMM 3901]
MNSITNTNVIDKGFDAIVIGTGISGGWAAKELCENGLKTLVLERGRMVEHVKDYKTATMDPWDFKFRGLPNNETKQKQFKQNRTGFVTHDSIKHWFVNDLKHPYNEIKRFDWIRGYHVGGRSLTWGRQALRMTDLDFEANEKEGIAVDWPIRYKDIEPWYTKVEKFIGVSGENLGLNHFPDGYLSPPIELNCVEDYFRSEIKKQYNNRHLTIGRFTNLTGEAQHDGRANCVYRNRCMRGCPIGGYFSSNASTLPAAEKTGNMELLPNAIVTELVYDDSLQKVTGVKVINSETKEQMFYKANIIFCCASTIGSTSILLQSKSKRFPNGLGNDSGELGHNLMDHHFQVGATATVEGFEDAFYKGKRPASFHIPRFRNLPDSESKQKFLRGYSFQGSASRTNWKRAIKELSYGKDLKESLLKSGPWKIGMSGFGECLPYHENKMTLDYNKLDEWGLPTVSFDCEYKENELLMREDIKNEAVNMLKSAGFKNVKGYNNETFPGIAIHEMGTARMGKDSTTSVLNAFNQLHSVPNVYVTDGACMTSSGNQNPSLTYMALTARAVNHAVRNYKKIK